MAPYHNRLEGAVDGLHRQTWREARLDRRRAEYTRRLKAFAETASDAPPTEEPTTVTLRLRRQDTRPIGDMLSADCVVVGSALTEDPDVIAYRIEVPRWPYQGRRATLVVSDNDLCRIILLGPAA